MRVKRMMKLKKIINEIKDCWGWEMMLPVVFATILIVCFSQVNNRSFWGYEKITEYTTIKVNKEITQKTIMSKNDNFEDSQEELNKIIENETEKKLYVIYATNLKTGEKRILFKNF